MLEKGLQLKWSSHLMPVRTVGVRVHLLREPLQVGADVVFEPLTVADVSSERAAVTHQRVHPVLVDELRQTTGEDRTHSAVLMDLLPIMKCCLFVSSTWSLVMSHMCMLQYVVMTDSELIRRVQHLHIVCSVNLMHHLGIRTALFTLKRQIGTTYMLDGVCIS